MPNRAKIRLLIQVGRHRCSWPAVKVPGMGGAMGNSCFPSGEKQNTIHGTCDTHPLSHQMLYDFTRNQGFLSICYLRDPIKNLHGHHSQSEKWRFTSTKQEDFSLLLVAPERGQCQHPEVVEAIPNLPVLAHHIHTGKSLPDFSVLLIFMRFTLICCMHLYATSPCLASLLWSTGSRARTLCH